MFTKGLVTCLEHVLHGLEDGDMVVFKEVQGMEELNNGHHHKVTSKSPSEFYIGDTTKFSDYTSGGIVRKVKTKSTMHFVSFFSIITFCCIFYIPHLKALI
jgi:ubiquitin-activating enzyme E1